MSAQKIEHGEVVGTLLKHERVNGNFTGQDGGQVAYDYFELRVLTPAADLCVLRVPADNLGRPNLPIPPTGEDLHALVEYRAAGGNVKATVTAFVAVDDLATV